jgi:hypothetical protein
LAHGAATRLSVCTLQHPAELLARARLHAHPTRTPAVMASDDDLGLDVDAQRLLYACSALAADAPPQLQALADGWAAAGRDAAAAALEPAAAAAAAAGPAAAAPAAAGHDHRHHPLRHRHLLQTSEVTSGWTVSGSTRLRRAPQRHAAIARLLTPRAPANLTLSSAAPAAATTPHPVSRQPDVPDGALTAAQAFRLHSRPDSPWKLLLDFGAWLWRSRGKLLQPCARAHVCTAQRAR